MNHNNRVGVSSSQIINSQDIQIKMIGGKAVVIRSQKEGTRSTIQKNEQTQIQTEEQQEVSKMASSGIEESQR